MYRIRHFAAKAEQSSFHPAIFFYAAEEAASKASGSVEAKAGTPSVHCCEYHSGTGGKGQRPPLGHESRCFSNLFRSGTMRALLVGVTLMVLTQVTGFNATMDYAPEVFKLEKIERPGKGPAA